MSDRALFPSPRFPDFRLVPLLMTMGLWVGYAAQAAEKRPAAPSPEVAIRASAEAFLQAFNRADAKAVAELWTPDGTLASDGSEPLKGRSAIQQEYTTFFQQHPAARMKVAITSIEFPTETIAIEDGTAQVETQHGGAPAVSRYFTHKYGG